jgi:putative ABC transport system substrate-binding protein
LSGNTHSVELTVTCVTALACTVSAFSSPPPHDTLTARECGRREEALRALSNDGGLILLPGNFNALHRQAIAELAARYRVPAISPFDFYPNVGGLMSYGTVSEDEFRNAAIYMDRIFFKGTNPGDLPVQMPTKFKLVINAKTAKSLGLIVPHSLLARADEVIE